MTANEKIYIAFDSTHAAMASQKKLAAFSPAVIPTPREITASCGMTLLLKSQYAAEAWALISASADISALCSFYTESFEAYSPASASASGCEAAQASSGDFEHEAASASCPSVSDRAAEE